MEAIESYIHNYFGIGGRDLSPVAALFKNVDLSQDDYLLKKGKYVSSLSFVKSGYLRVFAPDHHDEKEVTQWVASGGSFITDLSSFIFGTPSRWYIQALSPCELYTISKEDYHSIDSLVTNWPELEKLFIAKCFITLEQRIFDQISKTAEHRVIDLLQQNPQIFNEVPLKYIASMLGMTPETLSRIRRKMAS